MDIPHAYFWLKKKLVEQYSNGEKNYSLKKLSFEVKVYSDCSDVLAVIEHTYFGCDMTIRYELFETEDEEQAMAKAGRMVERFKYDGFNLEEKIQKK